MSTCVFESYAVQAQAAAHPDRAMTRRFSGVGAPSSCLPQDPAATTQHQLPGGASIRLGREGWQLGEALLHGRVLGLDEPSVAESAAAAAMTHPDLPTRKVPPSAPMQHRSFCRS